MVKAIRSTVALLALAGGWFLGPLSAASQSTLAPAVAWHDHAYEPPPVYGCPRATGSLIVDGRLTEPSWTDAPWSAPFVDIQGDRRPPPRFRTRVKMLWDDRAWYLAAELEDPAVWASIREHDAVIFHDNDFELFIDPDGDHHAYGELELNALNTTWDLFLPRPYKDGGQADNGWEIEGLQTAVQVDGTLNQDGDRDRGWTVEMAIPFAGLQRLGVSSAPERGATWRVNFSRVQWRHQVVDGAYGRLPDRPEDNWVWSPQWVVNMHRPETWGCVVFQQAASPQAEFPACASALQHWLNHAYYLQKAYHQEHGRWAGSLEELRLAPPTDPPISRVGLELQPEGFVVWGQQQRVRWSLDHLSRQTSESSR